MSATARRTSLETSVGRLSAAFDGPDDADALVVLAHGAGARLDGEFMSTVAEGLGRRSMLVCRFNFLYAEQDRKGPDRGPILEDTWRAVLEALADVARDKSLILGGKSMGGRIASHVVADGATADGLVFLGYPLHPPGKPGRLRDEHLARIPVPMLFVEGTRDPFCPLETLHAVLQRLEADAEVAPIDGGDHSFKVRRSSGRTTQQAWREVTDAAAAWIEARIERPRAS
ncbi:MAG: alpha/beta family hydrolase [Actinomycetota bacterium]